MSDGFFDVLWQSFHDGWQDGAKTGPLGMSVRSRPSFWNPFHTWRDEETRSLRERYDKINAAFTQSPFTSADALHDIANLISDEACEMGQHAVTSDVARAIHEAALCLIGEEFFSFPIWDDAYWKRPPPLEETVLIGQFLDRKHRLFDNVDELFNTACGTIADIFGDTLGNLAIRIDENTSTAPQALRFDVPLIDMLDDPGRTVEHIVTAVFSKEIVDADLFHDLRQQVHHNVLAASGIDPQDTRGQARKIVMPTDANRKTPAELVDAYLAFTPFRDFLQATVSFAVPQRVRVEHCHVIGGTGHGKTQLLQQLIFNDLEAARTERLSVVVIDNQGDLIRKLSRLSVFAPDAHETLAERFLLIDPSDIDHPPALNLFDPGIKRLETYTPREREMAFNSLVDIYGRFFGALLGAELTARQGAVFRYLARLMLTIDGATIHTLIDLMDDIGPFKAQIAQLDPTARRFFGKEFSRPSFNATRQQIKQRLYAVLSIPTFDRLFSAPRSQINLFDVLNAGSIVFVNTAKDLLKPDGTAIFGRFILSLIEHAIMERSTIPEAERIPTYLYVDEAQDYFDETIESLLVQGRKFNFGLTLAHQSLAQLAPRLRAVIMGNTTVKLAGGVSDDDARALASDMRTTKDKLLAVRKHEGITEFALSVRNLTPHALRITIPFGTVEQELVLDEDQYAALLERNQSRISYLPGHELSRGQSHGSLNDTSDAESADAERQTHVSGQHQLATLAKERGFGAEVEYALPDGKRVDVALLGHGLSIAIEVSVTNREAYELSNIQKALDAKFDQVWMIADDPLHRENISKGVRQTFPPAALSRVTFCSFDDARTLLSHYEVPEGNQSTVVGYAVETIFSPPTSLDDHSYRRGQLRYLLTTWGIK